jgi:hypothetical protein
LSIPAQTGFSLGVTSKVHWIRYSFLQMDKELTAEDIQEALKFPKKNGKAPGLDGIPYEFFRMLEFHQTKGTSQVTFDIMSFFARLYTHIETNGITRGTNFNLQGRQGSDKKLPAHYLVKYQLQIND